MASPVCTSKNCVSSLSTAAYLDLRIELALEQLEPLLTRRALPLRAWLPGQERFDEGSEGRSFLEQEPVPGIGVEHQPCLGDEVGEDVVVGDRVELVFGAVGDERGHRDPGDLAPGWVDAVLPIG